MTTLTNTFYNDPILSVNVLQQPAEMTGGITYIFPWIATARNQIGAKVLPAMRSDSTCYMRGLKETVQFQSNNGFPWQWRRICISLKDQAMYNQGSTESAFTWWRGDSAGNRRFIGNVNGLKIGIYFIEQLFRGKQSIDWSSYFNAPVDNTKNRVHYDKTHRLASGNSQGSMRNFKMWHPMNKNIYYDDDENGANLTPSPFSVNDKRGMGDYMVIDIIAAGTGSGFGDTATFNIDSTLYWHEK